MAQLKRKSLCAQLTNTRRRAYRRCIIRAHDLRQGYGYEVILSVANCVVPCDDDACTARNKEILTDECFAAL